MSDGMQQVNAWLSDNGFGVVTDDTRHAVAGYAAAQQRLIADMHQCIVEMNEQFKSAVILRDGMINKLKTELEQLRPLLNEQLTVTIRRDADAKDYLIDEMAGALSGEHDCRSDGCTHCAAMTAYGEYVAERGEEVTEAVH